MLIKILIIVGIWVVSLIIEMILVNLFLKVYNYYGFNGINLNKLWIKDIIYFIFLVTPLILAIKLIL